MLSRICDETRVFEAWSDEAWIIDGAAVRVSLVCFGAGTEDLLKLDGKIVIQINSDLTSDVFNVRLVRRLLENEQTAFIGTQKGGPFDIAGTLARLWLTSALNPNGLSNSLVVRPWTNGMDIVRRPSDHWVVDFGSDMPEASAALFELPFEYVREHARPRRINLRRRNHAHYWWLHAESRPGMRRALKPLDRYIITPRVSRYRIFVWRPQVNCPDSATVAISRDDDTAFGILHSRFHEAWSLKLCTWLGVGNDPRYTPTTTFETFPFPDDLTPNIPAKDYANDPRAIAIATAAKRLDDLRNAWLNPPDLVRIEPEVVPGYPDRILPKDANAAAILRQRTLTNLYNQRPQWLADAHRDLDGAVAAAYGWPAGISEDDALGKLLELNLARAAASPAAERSGDDGEDD